MQAKRMGFATDISQVIMHYCIDTRLIKLLSNRLVLLFHIKAIGQLETDNTYLPVF
jgi:hypothetical protein